MAVHVFEDDSYLAHYGIKRRSGRYPWGSGDNYRSSRDFLGLVDELRKEGLSDTEIARGFGATTTEFRAAKTIAKNQRKQADITRAQRLHDKGMSNIEIAKQMYGSASKESTVRGLLAPGAKDKSDLLTATANELRQAVDSKTYVDVGAGNEIRMNVSRNNLDVAVAMLRSEGYELHPVQTPQLGGPNKTTMKVLAPPGTKYKDVAANIDQVQLVRSYSTNNGRSYSKILTPLSVDSSRLGVRYAEDGGGKADGVIYVRPGVHDLSMGRNHYAQIRIAVDGSHYLKGMAMYKDDLPDGVDLLFNTNKKNTGNKIDALKELSGDKENPFGAIVRQIGIENEKGQVTKLTSAINLVNEEGDWERWKKTISSQVLSKQSPVLAKTQLNMTFEQKQNELNSILALTNPAVKRTLLEKFADSADASAVHLKAAALPMQASHVILPFEKMKDTEIYAPNYVNGTRVALIRYPHGGTFEIPELIVNNNHREAKRLLGDATAAVGINHKVAERLSGADFDGDTVLVIPNGAGKIKSTPALEKLKGFDPQRTYPGYEGMKKMDARTKGKEMGSVSNLITDMTIKKASPDELARAVRHSMVVIDGEKHGLNWKQSALDNNIRQLQEKYQPRPAGQKPGGASTLVSKATSEKRVPKRKQNYKIDPVTGEKVWTYTNETKVTTKVSKRTGAVTKKIEPVTQKSTKLAEESNAHNLSSGTLIEKVYADHSNKLKSLANQARLESIRTPSTTWNDSAKRTFAPEVQSLKAKLSLAKRNAPLERQAQIIGNATYKAKLLANPEMDDTQKKRERGLALENARRRTGAGKDKIVFTEKEWEAIQAGAVSNHQLTEMLKHADIDRVKELATPRTRKTLMSTQKARATQMLAAGYTQAEIAVQLGVSLTTLKEGLKDV